MSKFFSNEEFNEVCMRSIPYPLPLVDEGNNMVEIQEVTAVSGMQDNEGVPQEITIMRHRIGEEPEELKYVLATSDLDEEE